MSRPSEKPVIDYDEIFAPVGRLYTIRTLIDMAVQKDWKLFQLYVKLAFLNGVLQEEVYVEQPDGFTVNVEDDKVYRLNKALYGLKQAPRAWYGEIDSYFTKCGFKRVPVKQLFVQKTTLNEECSLSQSFGSEMFS